MNRPRVVLLRGHNVNVWDLRPLERCRTSSTSACSSPARTCTTSPGLGLPRVDVAHAARPLPAGRAAGAAAYALGERYLGLDEHLRGADVVHAAEIGTWFTAQAARLKQRLGFKLVVTVWETLPWRATFRWPRERRYREAILPEIDLCIAATQRAHATACCWRACPRPDRRRAAPASPSTASRGTNSQGPRSRADRQPGFGPAHRC